MKLNILSLFLIAIILFLCYNNSNVENFKNQYLYTAIIIEPRKHKALEFVLNNFATNLSDEWNFIIFHGTENKSFVENIVAKMNRNVTLINLNVSNLTISDYNKLLTTKSFYDHIPTEVFMVFQTDTIINTKYKNWINNYVNYDYVGAPWNDKNVGNGGLSIRNKSKMLEIIDKCPYNNENEDVYFSLCKNVSMNKPSFDEATKFSVESVFNNNSFGYHKPWIHIDSNTYQTLESECDDLRILRELNKE